jgi:alkanesulfonate monooxygenase SsuD/methylene tetrahydromethanopterin reductase-like flavin-dependent oxidoreductase (luciferase family)
MPPPRLVLVLSENHTLVPPRDLAGLVAMAVEAERAGFDGVMVSEHIVLGQGADSGGTPENPRDYALPGNRTPRRRGPPRYCCSRPSPPSPRGCA